jgi:hypothetical protein
MPDRTINFGESETEATYQIQDTDAVNGGGNFVVAKDTNANTVLLEYDPAIDTWEYAGDVDMNGGNVSGVGTLTADSVNTDRLLNGRTGAELVDQNTAWAGFSSGLLTNPSDTSSTTYETIAELTGTIPLNEVPDGATLYGNLGVRPETLTGGETVDYRVNAVQFREGDGIAIPGILELTGISDTNHHTTGWTEITTVDPSSWEMLNLREIEARVSGGTVTHLQRKIDHTLSFTWRVD